MTISEDQALAWLRDRYAPIAQPGPGNEDEQLATQTVIRVVLADAASNDSDVDPPKPPRGGRRAKARVPRAAAIAVPAAVAVAAIVLAVTLLSTSSSALAQKFPIFASPSTKPARAALRVLPQPRAGASTARVIHTRHGKGYVLASTNDRDLCIALPASSREALLDALARAPGSSGSNVQYVGGCAATKEAEQKGVVLTLPLHRRVEIVVVLPTGASAPIVHARGGKARTLRTNDGTATAAVQAPAVLEFDVRGTRVSAAVKPGVARPVVVTPRER